MTPNTELIEMIDEFLSGRDRSMNSIRKIENTLIEHFLDSEVFEFLAEPISLYRPWEGTPYIGEQEMAQVLSEVRAFLIDHS
ncbi:hypothetical protein [Streptomyces sp. NPDC002067]